MENYNLFKSIQIGTTIKSRKGKEVGEVISFNSKKDGTITGFKIVRPTGKIVSISKKSIEKILARLLAGEQLKFQANPPQGGISYTVAIEASVVHALQHFILIDEKNRVYRLKVQQ